MIVLAVICLIKSADMTKRVWRSLVDLGVTSHISS